MKNLNDREVKNSKEAFAILGIEEFHDAVWHAHSSGELYFIFEYIRLAELIRTRPDIIEIFRVYFSTPAKDDEYDYRKFYIEAPIVFLSSWLQMRLAVKDGKIIVEKEFS